MTASILALGDPTRALSPSLPGLTVGDFMRMIDHSVLAPDATEDDVRLACAEACVWNVASVCVRPKFVRLVAELLRGSGVRTCTVISFFEGTNDLADKRKEALQAIADGAQEIDWVFNYRNIPACSADDRPASLVRQEIEAIEGIIRENPNVTLKVIIETCCLENPHKVWIVKLLAQARVRIDFAKTSTGFGTPRNPSVPKGATSADVGMMYGIAEAFGGERRSMDVKASGGIKTLTDAIAMIVAGARRLGIGAQGVRDIVRELSAV